MLTLLEGWSLDKTLALATAVYGVDFAPTRHITTGNARGRLEGYTGAVFGRVEAIHCMGPKRGLLVRLGRPVDVSCVQEFLCQAPLGNSPMLRDCRSASNSICRTTHKQARCLAYLGQSQIASFF
ncbi:hypothetical protein DFH09DRAFT_1079247 [Mycena vulgaris]|nr:hypothetical protein DFH09DRAFT_1079247 [Mycena vulgaris]